MTYNPTTPRYPHVTVDYKKPEMLSAFFLGGAVAAALNAAGIDRATIAEFREEFYAGDYDHALQVAYRWVTVIVG